MGDIIDRVFFYVYKSFWLVIVIHLFKFLSDMVITEFSL